jgi:pantoate kinase
MKENIVKAFAPANISCIFKVYKHKNPRLAGSWGLGFTLSEGVVVTVETTRVTTILFNGKKVDMPTVFDVVQALTTQNILITIETKLPLGCGFGISGAAALATVYAVNKLLDLKKTKKELAIIAHTKEVKNKTGLGDVTNQFFGGFLFKKKPSSNFSVIKIPLKEKTVYCRVFSPLSTKSVLSNSNLLAHVNDVAKEGLEEIGNDLSEKNVLTLAKILSISKQFAAASGLLQEKDVIRAIEEIEEKGGNATMIMLGNAVVSNISFSGATKFFLSQKGAMLL